MKQTVYVVDQSQFPDVDDSEIKILTNPLFTGNSKGV